MIFVIQRVPAVGLGGRGLVGAGGFFGGGFGFFGRCGFRGHGLHGLQHFVHVADFAFFVFGIVQPDFHAAPFAREFAFGINQKRAALDAFDLAAIHDLVFDHAEHVAQLFFGIGNQLERQFVFGLESVVRIHVVAANAENGGACFDEFGVFVAKLLAFARAAGRVVFRVEVKHQHLPDMRNIGDLNSSGGHGFKFGQRFVDDDCHGNSCFLRGGTGFAPCCAARHTKAPYFNGLVPPIMQAIPACLRRPGC